MARTVIGLFERMDDARAAVNDLVAHGFQREDISFMARQTTEGAHAVGEGETRGEHVSEGAGTGAGIGAVVGGIGGLLVGLGTLAIPGIGPLVAAGPIISTIAGAGLGAGVGTLLGALVGLGVPREEAEYYAEGVRRGGTLVAVKTSDDRANNAAEILESHNPSDIQRRAEEWRAEGWTPESMRGEEREVGQVSVGDRPTSEMSGVTHETDRGGVPMAGQELEVGKREVDETGRRLRSDVSEEPLSEDLRLSDEEVHVEGPSVDHPLSDLETSAIYEEEEEEIDLESESRERTESVSGTMRRTESEMEDLGTSTGIPPTGSVDDAYRSHFSRIYGSRGLDFDRYLPAYRWGGDLAASQEWQDRDWGAVQEDIRRRWEARNPGTWADYVDAIREGWNIRRGGRTIARGI